MHAKNFVENIKIYIINKYIKQKEFVNTEDILSAVFGKTKPNKDTPKLQELKVQVINELKNFLKQKNIELGKDLKPKLTNAIRQAIGDDNT